LKFHQNDKKDDYEKGFEDFIKKGNIDDQ